MSAKQQNERALQQQRAADDKAATDKAPRHEGIIGSNILPSEVMLDGVKLQAGEIVQIAFENAGLGKDEWNQLAQSDREARIATTLAEFEAAAKAEAEARAKREASRAVLAAKRSEQAPAALALPEADQPQGLVFDATARIGEPRSHEIVVGKHPNGDPIIRRYKLASDTPTVMPMDHAMKFLVDRAFRVTDVDGNVIKPVEKTDERFANVRLDPDQVIARLEDLSVSALLKQVKLLPDSQRFGTNSAPEDMIDFIVAHRKAANRIGISRGSEAVQEDSEAGQILDLRVPVTA